MSAGGSSGSDNKMTCIGGAFVFLLILGSLAGAGYMFFGDQLFPSNDRQNNRQGNNSSTSSSSSGHRYRGDAVEIGIAYGTEKKRWLKWAAEEFEKTADGKKIKVDLIPRGSREGAQEVLDGNEKIHVWSPASALMKNYFINEWQVKHGGGDPIIRGESLALSPMVFVFWEERYRAFTRKYEAVNFRTLGEAMLLDGGWGAIAEKPEWGFFKFGHTDPTKSNSGGVALILMTCEYHDKSAGLTLADITDVQFQQWLKTVENAVAGLSHSTGTMMREMVLKGPSSFDVLCVYENLAIDYLKNAEGRWGKLHVAYPSRNMWNDNPYYILDVPWSSKEQRAAAEAFLEFLLREPIQKQALEHGFRPANVKVPVKFPESPFVRYESYGLKIDIQVDAEAPKGEVIENLLHSWQRSRVN